MDWSGSVGRYLGRYAVALDDDSGLESYLVEGSGFMYVSHY